MLENIQNNNSIADVITQNTKLDGINGYGTTNPIENDKNYFIDQSEISKTALEKYLKEEDVKKFSQILLETDEKEATNRVIEKIFGGEYTIENDEFLTELINNNDFLNDILS